MSAAMELPQPGKGNWRDDYCTPQYISDRLTMFGPVALDPCWNFSSVIDARVAFVKHDNGLERCWATAAAGGLVFVNYPYGDPMPWARKIDEEAAKGCEIIVLNKVGPETDWWNLITWQNASAVGFLTKRVGFIGVDGVSEVAKFPSALSYIGRRPARFDHVFSCPVELRGKILPLCKVVRL